MRVILFISIENLSERRLVRMLCCKILTILRDIHVLYFLIQRGFPEYKTHSLYSFPVNESPLVYDNDLRIDRKTHSFHRLSTKYSSVLVINSLGPKRHQQTNIALMRPKFLMQCKMRSRCRSLTWQLFPYGRKFLFQGNKEWNKKIHPPKPDIQVINWQQAWSSIANDVIWSVWLVKTFPPKMKAFSEIREKKFLGLFSSFKETLYQVSLGFQWQSRFRQPEERWN